MSDEVTRKFPVGSTVYLTEHAAAMFPKLQGRRGTVVRHDRTGQPCVVWFVSKSTSSGSGWAEQLLQRKPAP
jgi:hypothetical protein